MGTLGWTPCSQAAGCGILQDSLPGPGPACLPRIQRQAQQTGFRGSLSTASRVDMTTSVTSERRNMGRPPNSLYQARSASWVAFTLFRFVFPKTYFTPNDTEAERCHDLPKSQQQETPTPAVFLPQYADHIHLGKCKPATSTQTLTSLEYKMGGKSREETCGFWMTSSLTGTRLLRPLSSASRYINETITDAQISSRSCKAAEVSLREAMVPRSCPGPATQAGLESVGTLGFKRAMYKLEFASLKDLNTWSPRSGTELGILRRGRDLEEILALVRRGEQTQFMSLPRAAREQHGMDARSTTGICS